MLPRAGLPAVPAGAGGLGAPLGLALLFITWAQVKERGASRDRARLQLAVIRSEARRRACGGTAVREQCFARLLLGLSTSASFGSSRFQGSLLALPLTPQPLLLGFPWKQVTKLLFAPTVSRFVSVLLRTTQRFRCSGGAFHSQASATTIRSNLPSRLPALASFPRQAYFIFLVKKKPLKLRGSEFSPGAFLAAGGVGTAEGFRRKILFVDNSWLL